MVAQLRLYIINKGKMDEFVKGWKEGVYPLHLKHGFRIDKAGVIKEMNQFFWIVSYDGPEDWDTKQAAYYGSPERAALDPDPAQFIARADRCFWTLFPFLPSYQNRTVTCSLRYADRAQRQFLRGGRRAGTHEPGVSGE